jgi:hypothetical protein
MKTISILMMCLALLAARPDMLRARSLVVSPEKTVTIVSPADARDCRALVYFELPKEIGNSKARVDFAELILKAGVADANLGRIDVFPVTTDWKDAEAISWSGLWANAGGDYSADFNSSSYSLKSEAGMVEISIDVTAIVQAWRTGVLANNGFIVKLSADDLTALPVKVAFGQEAMALKVKYSLSPR